jgi:hypothetical protein
MGFPFNQAYFRSEKKEHVPLSRYLQPHTQFMTAVTCFNDRNMVNQCLMYRYIISYEPYNFKGRLDDFPLTLQYGQALERYRLVDAPDWRPASQGVQIPAQSAAVLL